MSAATWSLIALVVAIAVSMVSGVNVGILSMAMAFLVGTTIAGLNAAQVIKGFPADLFMLLLGVTFLFSLAEVNGTLERITKISLRLVGRYVALLPFTFFFLGLLVSAIGPGAIPATALLAAPTMAAAAESGISPLLMGVMLIHGTIAGTMSPIAPMGVVVSKIVTPMVGNVSVKLFLNVLVANALIATGAYFIFGGMGLLKRVKTYQANVGAIAAGAEKQQDKWELKHILTIIGILILIVLAIGFKFDVGLTALTIAAVLSWVDRNDEGKALKRIPWSTIMMVCGVMILINIMGKTGGIDLIGKGVASFTSPWTAPAVLAFLAGLISIYSSTTGVVLPAFLPLVPGVVSAVGGGSMMAMISCLVLTGNVVDASPLSTLGALVLASAVVEDKNKLFRNLMIWGVAMAFVGTLVGWILYVALGL